MLSYQASLVLLGTMALFGQGMAAISSSGCGSTKFCMMLPEGCSPSSADCVFFSWVKEGDDFMMELSGGSGNGNTYAAVAFGQEDQMKDADLYYCTGSSFESGVITTLHDPPTKLNVQNEDGIKLSTSSTVNGVAECTFTRAASVTKTITTGAKNFDLTAGSYHILLARGDVSGGNVGYHQTNRVISGSMINLAKSLSTPSTTVPTAEVTPAEATEATTTVPVASPEQTTEPKTSAPSTSPDCTKEQCFQYPTNCQKGSADCIHFSWEYDSSEKAFSMEIIGGAGGGSTYSAVAFTESDEMKDADLYYCTGDALESGVITTLHDPPKKLESTNGVTLSSASTDNGVAKCSFTRPVSVTKTISSGDADFDLSKQKYRIMLATGDITDGEVAYHKGSRIISGEKIQLASGGFSTRCTNVTSAVISLLVILIVKLQLFE